MRGAGNQIDYGMRVYDPRAGRFMSVDPLTNKYPFYTPYQFTGNNPIQFIDLDGEEPALPGHEGQVEKAPDYTTVTSPNLPKNQSWFTWMEKPFQLGTNSGVASGEWEKTLPPSVVTATIPNKSSTIVKGIDGYPQNLIKSGLRFDGVQEKLPDGSSNPVVLNFIHSVNNKKNITNTDLPWCSCFMNYNTKESGIAGTDNAMALSWRKWGTPIPGPVVGSITTIPIGDQGSGHVNVVVGIVGNKLALLGGNQSDQVSVVLRSWNPKYQFNIPSAYFDIMKDSIDKMTKANSWMKSLPVWHGKIGDGTKTR